MDDSEAAAEGDAAEARVPDAGDDGPDGSTAGAATASEERDGLDVPVDADAGTETATADTGAFDRRAHAAAGDGDAGSGPALGERRRLDARVQLVWGVRVVVLSAVVGVLTWIAATRGPVPRWTVAAATVGVLALTTAYVRARFRLWRYEVRDDALYLERGVFTRVRTVVPLVRVQHTDTARNPIERALGLASTVVYTAGSRGADVSVPGLTREDAESLQRLLKRLAVEAGDEDAV